MSEYTYTAEDFSVAQLAIDLSTDDPDEQYWARWDDDSDAVGNVWRNYRGQWTTDDGMVERRRIPIYAEPYSPEALRRAWEHGEKPKPGEFAEEGVSYIWRNGNGQCTLLSDGSQSPLIASERVVYRPSAPKPAPERDPVADLAQALEDALPEEAGSPVALRRYAEALAGYGVRVVTDDE